MILVYPVDIDITTTSVTVLPQNPRRSFVTFVNDSTSWMYLEPSENAAVAHQGIPISPSGGSYTQDKHTPYYGKYNVIAHDAGTNRLCIREYSYASE